MIDYLLFMCCTVRANDDIIHIDVDVPTRSGQVIEDPFQYALKNAPPFFRPVTRTFHCFVLRGVLMQVRCLANLRRGT
jgi:hypothetical protein